MPNRRKFLCVLGGASVVGVIATGQANAQSSSQSPPPETVLSPVIPVDRELTGKVAIIITGARNNLGRGYAVALARNGADVVVHYHREVTRDQAEETARLVQQQGRAHLVSGDLSQLANIRKLFDETIQTFGKVDIVVHNAGRSVKKPLAEVTEAEYDRAAGINSKGSFFIMQEAVRRIADEGRVINAVSSLVAANIPNYSAYTGTKAAIEQFTRALAKEIDWKRNITVNSIASEPIDTPFYRAGLTPEDIERGTRLAGRLGEIDDIVPLVEFLASPRSRWVNGQTILVNGGYVSR